VKNPFQIGDKKHFRKRVLPEETARFESGEVHPFYGTFALARDAEWSSRLFVLDMKEEDEEGIGTFVEVQHLSPALVGDEVEFTAVLVEQQKNNVICSIEAKVGERMIAKGRTGQKILKKEKLKQISAQIEAS
jgi:predicted thioesterase